MNAEPDPVVCLSCGELRTSPTSQPECPVCDYEGWLAYTATGGRGTPWAEHPGEEETADPAHQPSMQKPQYKWKSQTGNHDRVIVPVLPKGAASSRIR